MRHKLGVPFLIEIGLATLTMGMFLLTLVRRDWIEAVVGFDPDHHGGSLEWIISGMLLAASIAFTAFARAEWRRRAALAN